MYTHVHVYVCVRMHMHTCVHVTMDTTSSPEKLVSSVYGTYSLVAIYIYSINRGVPILKV